MILGYVGELWSTDEEGVEVMNRFVRAGMLRSAEQSFEFCTARGLCWWGKSITAALSWPPGREDGLGSEAWRR